MMESERQMRTEIEKWIGAAAVLVVALAAMAALGAGADADAPAEPEYSEEFNYYGFTIQFTFAGGDAQSVIWDFGDGSAPVNEFNPIHTFAGAGVYYVTQTASNTQGDSTAVYKINIMGYPVVHFDSNGGTAIQDIEMEGVNQRIEQPADPVKAGYAFKGWFVDQSCIQPYNWNTLVSHTMTLYAKWAPIHTVAFNLNNGEDTLYVQVVDGELLTEPSNVERAGYDLYGWYKDSKFTQRYSFSEPVTETFVLYAKWTVHVERVLVTYEPGEGAKLPIDTPRSEYVAIGSQIILPKATMDGYKMTGWYTGDAEHGFTKVGKAGDKYAVSDDIILTAQWVEDTGSGFSIPLVPVGGIAAAIVAALAIGVVAHSRFD